LNCSEHLIDLALSILIESIQLNQDAFSLKRIQARSQIVIFAALCSSPQYPDFID